MRFYVLTIFPAMFDSPMSESIIARAVQNGIVQINIRDIRDHARDKHRSVDDYPFGGGYGMVMKPEPIFDAVSAIQTDAALPAQTPVILLTPQGEPLTQPLTERLATHSDLILICGRYEGIDDRVRQRIATHEISIGDYVLSGGELAAMVMIDAITRLIPGALGSIESAQDDTFTTGLIQYPQYTRPADFRGIQVPDVLLSGNHAEIARWRRQQSLIRTLNRRPDLLQSANLSPQDRQFLAQHRQEQAREQAQAQERNATDQTNP